jgi:hypothetical protein
VRLLATIVLWLLATVALAVAVPACWAQRNLIDVDGYVALARSSAQDPALQKAMAAELTRQDLTDAHKSGQTVRDADVRAADAAFTADPSFPDQFAKVNRLDHQWFFTDLAQQDNDLANRDVSPMLSVYTPSSVAVPVSGDSTTTLRPGQLRPLATWGPWVSIGTVVVAAVAALLTLATARRRGRALAALGVSALLVGGGGWAALEIGRHYIDNALNQTTGDVHTIAGVMIANAEASLHQWLNLTLAAGVALVVLGLIVTMLGALRKTRPRWSATGTRTSTRP